MDRLRLVAAAFCLALITPIVYAQERTGPPPALRAMFDALIQGANGNAAGWEAFAQAHFTDAYLKQTTAEQRVTQHAEIAARFGSVSLDRVIREGPDAPLRVYLKGSKANGVLALDLENASSKIARLRIEAEPTDTSDDRAGGVPRPPVNGSLRSDEIDTRLSDYFARLAAGEVFSGVALVARNGVPVFFKAYGMADREKRTANTIRTRFNIGSINKAFTQLAIRQLMSEGKLSPADTVGKFFPDYPQAVTRAATVEQLLSHRAGVSDFFGSQFNAAPKSQFASNADYFTFVSSLPPTFAPGERNQYCNGCYITLGAIVEKVSGMPYEKYVADHVFARAEMTSTGYPRSDRPEPDIALGYTRRSGDGTLRSNIAMHGVTGSAAGGGYSTALDLLTYVKAVQAGKFPGADPDIGIAGGAPGTNAIVETRGQWTVIVLTNFDPPVGQQVGISLADALSSR